MLYTQVQAHTNRMESNLYAPGENHGAAPAAWLPPSTPLGNGYPTKPVQMAQALLPTQSMQVLPLTTATLALLMLSSVT
jgi:hypothetical protein